MTFLLSVFHASTSAIARFFSRASTWFEWRLYRSEIQSIPELEKLLATFRASPEASWSIGDDDIIRLYQLIRRLKPKRVLELGTGIGFSTAVMALGLKENGSGRVTSLEQVSKCVDIARSLIPKELQAFTDIVQADPEIFQVPGVSRWINFCGYKWQPKPGEVFDFVLVDGPAGWMQDGELVSLDNGDVFRLLPFLAPDARVYIDGRRATVKKIKRYLSRHLELVEHTHEFALFRRNATPIKTGEPLAKDSKATTRPTSA